MGIIVSILVGALAGWLGGVVVEGKGFGLIGNIIVGIVGSLLGQLLLSPIGIEASNILGNILVATFGSAVLLTVVNLIKR